MWLISLYLVRDAKNEPMVWSAHIPLPKHTKKQQKIVTKTDDINVIQTPPLTFMQLFQDGTVPHGSV